MHLGAGGTAGAIDQVGGANAAKQQQGGDAGEVEANRVMVRGRGLGIAGHVGINQSLRASDDSQKGACYA